MFFGLRDPMGGRQDHQFFYWAVPFDRCQHCRHDRRIRADQFVTDHAKAWKFGAKAFSTP
jgi:hypothetical protein